MIAALFILAVSLISIVFYDNRRSIYAADKTVKLGSAPMFSYLYRYIQASTILFALGGCLFYDCTFLDGHDSTLIVYCGVVIAALGIQAFHVCEADFWSKLQPVFRRISSEFTNNDGPISLCSSSDLHLEPNNLSWSASDVGLIMDRSEYRLGRILLRKVSA